MRLLEGEVRMASMTASAPGPSRITQASNFSFCRRCAESAGICTASIPNCLKQSARIAFVESLRSTKAMRAAAFLVWGMGAKAVPKAVCIFGAEPQLQSHFGLTRCVCKGSGGPILGYKSVITMDGLTGYFGLLKTASGAGLSERPTG